MSTNNRDIKNIGLDEGFGGFKAATIDDGKMRTVHLPSVVGIGTVELGMLADGILPQTRQPKNRGNIPVTVQFGSRQYLTGHNVHNFTHQPIERLDFNRLSQGPEFLALTFSTLGLLLGPGTHKANLLIGLPIEITMNPTTSDMAKQNLKEILLGTHRFTIDGQEVCLTIANLTIAAQPIGTYFNWGFDTQCRWIQDKSYRAVPISVSDFGFNTNDTVGLQGGKVMGTRYTKGDQQGMHKALEVLIRNVKQAYRRDLSLYEADQLIRASASKHPPILYHRGGQADVTELIEQALDQLFSAVVTLLNSVWENDQFPVKILTGGAVVPLRSRLLKAYPEVWIPENPTFSNAEGFAKVAAVQFEKPAARRNGASQQPATVAA